MTHRSDSGGASFLGAVWDAFQAWRASQDWTPVSVPRLKLEHYEAALAVGGPHALSVPAMPNVVPGVPEGASPAEVCAKCLLCILAVIPCCNLGTDMKPSVGIIAALSNLPEGALIFE